MDYQLSASDITSIITKQFGYKEEFTSHTYTITGAIDNFSNSLERILNEKIQHKAFIINEHNHWWVIFISKKKCNQQEYLSIGVFDSLASKNVNNDYVVLLINFLNKNSLKYKITFSNIKKQNDNYSCGLFVIVVTLTMLRYINDYTCETLIRSFDNFNNEALNDLVQKNGQDYLKYFNNK